MENKHTISDLYQMQSLSLNSKVAMTKARIRGWVEEYGEDGVYISFSGGKDSAVLLHIARQIYPNLKAAFIDTGLEYPEIREFVKTFSNVDWLRPKMNFKTVIETYGYPFISKEVSECVDGARRYVKALTDRQTDRQTDRNLIRNSIVNYLDAESMQKPTRGGQTTSIANSEELENIAKENGTVRLKILMGVFPSNGNKDRSRFNCSRYKFFLDAPFEISSKCCSVMKKGPAHDYAKKTGRKPMTAQMASESRLRTQQWLKNGCNGFDMKSPISNPMSFWTEQDVLLYIYENKIPIASVYGDIVRDYQAEGHVQGQLSFADYGIFDLERPLLKTTGCSRTGCVFCGYGCHLEKEGEGRFERLKMTHPKIYEYIFKPTSDGGLGYKEIIDWINEHGNLHIRY